jgi:SRSO17 transposase
VRLIQLVAVAGRRWTIEESFQGGKGLAGLDEHQVRRWLPWRRWTLLAMLAHAPQGGGDVQRHLVPAVRDAAARRPAVLQHLQRAQVLDQAVAQRAVELQPVAVGRMPP